MTDLLKSDDLFASEKQVNFANKSIFLIQII